MWTNPYRPPYPNELYHHGIKGQAWGITNGPPYPLNQEKHSKVISKSKEDRIRAKEEKAKAKASAKEERRAVKTYNKIGKQIVNERDDSIRAFNMYLRVNPPKKGVVDLTASQLYGRAVAYDELINFYGKSVNSKNIDFYTRNFEWTYKAPNGYTYIIPLNDVRNCSLK